MRSGQVHGKFVSTANRDLIDTTVAAIGNAGSGGVVGRVWRRAADGAGEDEAPLVRGVSQRYQLRLNALQFTDDRGPVAIGKCAVATLDAETDRPLQGGHDRTQRRIGG